MRIYFLFGCLVLLASLSHNKAATPVNPSLEDIFIEDGGSGEGEDGTFTDDEDLLKEVLEGSGHHQHPPTTKGPYGAEYDVLDNNIHDEDAEDGEEYEHSGDGLGDFNYHGIVTAQDPAVDVFEDDEIIIEYKVPPEELPPKREDSPPMFSTTPPPTFKDQSGMDSTIQIVNHPEDDRQVSIFAQPGILAAFIGGAIVGLFFAILFVMFVVYRMRKKDEGSYPLDEQKRLPLTASYSPNDKEIYA